MFLHGDLQHYNVLRDEVRGWLAIDPKGVVAELEYEIGSILRNPVELAELVIKPTAISRRLSVLTTELRPNHGLGVLPGGPPSAIWDIEDGFSLLSNNPSILLTKNTKTNAPLNSKVHNS